MHVLCEGLSKSVSQGLDHDVVVVIAISHVLVAEFILLETSGHGKRANIIFDSRIKWCDEISHGNKAILVQVELLTESEELSEGLAAVWMIYLDVIVSDLVAGIEADNSTGFDKFLIDELFEHSLSVLEKLLGLLADCLVVEDLRVGPVGILASDLPSREEWVPVKVGQDKVQVEV